MKFAIHNETKALFFAMGNCIIRVAASSAPTFFVGKFIFGDISPNCAVSPQGISDFARLMGALNYKWVVCAVLFILACGSLLGLYREAVGKHHGGKYFVFLLWTSSTIRKASILGAPLLYAPLGLLLGMQIAMGPHAPSALNGLWAMLFGIFLMDWLQQFFGNLHEANVTSVRQPAAAEHLTY